MEDHILGRVTANAAMLPLALAVILCGPTFGQAAGQMAEPAVIAVASGTGHACALLAEGTIRCWGENDDGQLGNGRTDGPSPPVAVKGISTATAIAAGGAHTCALLADGTVRCWGANLSGQLGNETTEGSLIPARVSGVSDAVAIGAGSTHTCAVLADRTVRCWGSNVHGELGNGTTHRSTVPAPVEGIRDALAVTGGAAHTCALLGDRTVRCWGSNLEGQLGNGSADDSRVPVAVPGLSIAVQVSAGGFHTCALLAGGGAQCWGSNEAGQLGNGVNIPRSRWPVTLPAIETATGIVAGLFHTCALLATGLVQCTGANSAGQLGVGPQVLETPDPVTVARIATATAMAAGGNHGCAVIAHRSIHCWGDIRFGRVNDEGVYVTCSEPQEVLALR